MIYLDHNATTLMDPEVLEAMRPYLAGFAGNASSRHAAGRRARQAIDSAALRLANALNADPDAILFTSGATEANNLALQSMIARVDRLVLSSVEHPSVLEPAKKLAGPTLAVETLAVNSAGIVFESLSTSYSPLPPAGPLAACRKRQAGGLGVRGPFSDSSSPLAASSRPASEQPPTSERIGVAIQLANSETGVIQPIRALRDRFAASWFHCDAAQAIGRIPVDFTRLGVSTMSISGHKAHGPTGIGALIFRPEAAPRPSVWGGHQQRGLRAGTEPVALIVGLARAVELAVARLESDARELAQRRDELEARLVARLDSVVVNGRDAERLPNTTNLSFLGISAELLVIALDLEGVACSTGTACASGSVEPSPVLAAMGIDGDRWTSAVRFSVARTTTPSDIAEAAVLIEQTVLRLRAAGPMSPTGLPH